MPSRAGLVLGLILPILYTSRPGRGGDGILLVDPAPSAVIHARVEPATKRKVEELFARLGLSTTEASTLFFKQVELRKGLPFEVRIPTDACSS